MCHQQTQENQPKLAYKSLDTGQGSVIVLVALSVTIIIFVTRVSSTSDQNHSPIQEILRPTPRATCSCDWERIKTGHGSSQEKGVKRCKHMTDSMRLYVAKAMEKHDEKCTCDAFMFEGCDEEFGGRKYTWPFGLH